MTDGAVRCSAAPRWRDRHLAVGRQYHLTDPDGRQLVFCSACCLLGYAVYGLPADLEGLGQNTGRNTGETPTQSSGGTVSEAA
jgi:hypothetical protein